MRLSKVLVLGCALLWTACGLESPDPVAEIAAPNGPAARLVVARVAISSAPSPVLTGQMLHLEAVATSENGVQLADRIVSWSTSDQAVAKVIPYQTTTAKVAVIAQNPGVATISVEVEGVTASVRFRVVSGGPLSTALVIESASVVEFQYPSAPGRWNYAPLVRVRDFSSTGATVVGLTFTVAGIGTGKCAGTQPVPPGGALDLFHEVYGDYELTMDHGTARATAREADITVLVADTTGGVALIGAKVPVVEGDLPTTYSGGRVVNPWSC